ncbi:MAG: SDR family oxidoreductase [Deltaproteobacteria bacterium]|nr:SDR family oxidoreductase [Deltaproteobacteria bacterium]
MTDFGGKTIVVTGAGGALGSGVLEVLEARGATIIAPTFEALKLDDEPAVVAFYAAIPKLWGSIHLVGGFAMAAFTETSLADFEKQWRMNTVTCFLACREAVRAIRRTGDGGRIVNVAARPVLSPAANMAAYAASKAGVASLTQSLAVEVVSEGILVNAILPSIIDTPANRAAMPKADFSVWPKPAELGQTIAYLMSPDNAVTSGALVPVYGKA